MTFPSGLGAEDHAVGDEIGQDGDRFRLAGGSPEGLVRWIDKVKDVVGGVGGRINQQTAALLRLSVEQALECTRLTLPTSLSCRCGSRLRSANRPAGVRGGVKLVSVIRNMLKP